MTSSFIPRHNDRLSHSAVYDSLADAFARKGEKKLAIENYQKAREMTKDPRQVTRIDGELAKLK